MDALAKDPNQITTEEIRTYLSGFQDKSASTRANLLKALRRFFRDYLKRPSVVESFKFPRRTYTPKTVPSKADLKRFFGCLENDRDRAFFLLAATSGLRRSELLGLSLDDLDLENRTIIPKNAHQNGSTKNSWCSCFNEEAQTYLRRYLENHPNNARLWAFGERPFRTAFKAASLRSGVKITPQILREWFCVQLGELGISDRFVDAFCGRTPKSVLARHYTDYSPNRLRTIYDKANLTVLT